MFLGNWLSIPNQNVSAILGGFPYQTTFLGWPTRRFGHYNLNSCDQMFVSPSCWIWQSSATTLGNNTHAAVCEFLYWLWSTRLVTGKRMLPSFLKATFPLPWLGYGSFSGGYYVYIYIPTYLVVCMYIFIIYVYGTAAPIYTWHVYGTVSGGLHLRPILWTCQKPDQDSPLEPPERLRFVGICSAVHRGSIYDKPKQCTKLTIHVHCLIPTQMGNLMIPDQYMVESLQIIRDVLFLLEVFMYIVILVTIYIYIYIMHIYIYKYVCVYVFIRFVSKFKTVHVLDRYSRSYQQDDIHYVELQWITWICTTSPT